MKLHLTQRQIARSNSGVMLRIVPVERSEMQGYVFELTVKGERIDRHTVGQFIEQMQQTGGAFERAWARKSHGEVMYNLQDLRNAVRKNLPLWEQLGLPKDRVFALCTWFKRQVQNDLCGFAPDIIHDEGYITTVTISPYELVADLFQHAYLGEPTDVQELFWGVAALHLSGFDAANLLTSDAFIWAKDMAHNYGVEPYIDRRHPKFKELLIIIDNELHPCS